MNHTTTAAATLCGRVPMTALAGIPVATIGALRLSETLAAERVRLAALPATVKAIDLLISRIAEAA